MKSLDTNITLRLLLRDVPEQLDKVLNLIDSSKSNSLMLEDAVLFECVWIMSCKMYRFDRQLVGKLLLGLTSIPQIICNKAMLEKAIPLYVSHKKISFVDACLTAYAELNNAMPLITFDRNLAETAPKIVTEL